MIRKAWEPDCIRSPMFKVAYKIKRCRLALLRWNKQLQGNSAVKIQILKDELETLRELEGRRDWERWFLLKNQFDITYKEEEMNWSQEARIQWLKEWDKNTHFFHANIVQRKKNNRIEQLLKEKGGFCNTEDEVVDEISRFYSELFTSEDTLG